MDTTVHLLLIAPRYVCVGCICTQANTVGSLPEGLCRVTDVGGGFNGTVCVLVVQLLVCALLAQLLVTVACSPVLLHALMGVAGHIVANSSPLQSISEHAGVLLPLLRDLALTQTVSSSTAESAAKTYSTIINKCPDSDSLCSTVTSDLELAWTKIRDGSPEEKQRAVTTILWVRRRL